MEYQKYCLGIVTKLNLYPNKTELGDTVETPSASIVTNNAQT